MFDKNVRSGAKAPTRNGQTEAWMKLVFKNIKFVHEVRVYFRFFTDWYRSVRCVVNLAKFKECVNEENDIELSVYLGENLVKICGTFRRTYGQEQSDQIYSLYCNVEGDSVMLRKTTPELIVIYEVVVTGKSIDKLFCHFITFNFQLIIKSSSTGESFEFCRCSEIRDLRFCFSVLKPEPGEITPVKVTQSRTYNDDEMCCNALQAVDKDLSIGAVSVMDNGEVWLKLEFDKTYFIGKIIVYFTFYNNWFGADDYWHESVENFRECVDYHNNVDVSVHKGDVKQKSNCGTLQLEYGLKQTDQIYTLVCNIRGDTVKFSKKSGKILVYEVVVLKLKAKEPEGKFKFCTCRPISYKFRGFMYIQQCNHTFQALSQGSS